MGRKKKETKQDKPPESEQNDSPKEDAPKKEKKDTPKRVPKVWISNSGVKKHVPYTELGQHFNDGWVLCPGEIVVYKQGGSATIDTKDAPAFFDDGWTDIPVQ